MITAVRSSQERAQGVLHEPLRRHVERRRGLVEDEHGGVGQEGAGERHQLALAGGEAGALLVDVGVVALGERGDEVVGPDGAGGGLDLGPVGAGAPEPDVVGDRAREQEALLGDGDDGAPQVDLGEVAQVDAVEARPRPRAGPRSGPPGGRWWSCRRRWRPTTATVWPAGMCRSRWCRTVRSR